jgi:hypothetical protein
VPSTPANDASDNFSARMSVRIREFRADDANAVNRVVLAAWRQYRELFSNWARIESVFENAASMAAKVELIVAESEHSIVGCVGYVGPRRERGGGVPRISDTDVPRPPVLQRADFAEIIELVRDDNPLEKLDALVAELSLDSHA